MFCYTNKKLYIVKISIHYSILIEDTENGYLLNRNFKFN